MPPSKKSQSPARIDIDQPVQKSRPAATATVSRVRLRGADAGQHAIELVLELVQDREQTMAVARRALAGFEPGPGELDRRSFGELCSSRRNTTGAVDVKVVGIKGEATWPERPTGEPMELLRAALFEAGYRVALKERRECSQSGCTSEVLSDWERPDDIPSAWFSAITCGKHNLKQCPKCSSIYLLTSYNAAGQAPSVHCEVCAHVLIEWGGSKRWDAELVTRGAWLVQGV